MKDKIPNKYIEIKYIFGLTLLILGIVFGNSLRVHATDYTYVEGIQTVTLGPGSYIVEAWGSKGPNGLGGGSGMNTYFGGTGGNGGYAKGILSLGSTTTIYIVGTSGTENVRLNVNDPANNILIGGAGSAGGDAVYDDEFSIFVANGYPGNPGTGAAYSPLIMTTTSSGVNSGPGKVSITVFSNANPVIALSSPTTSTTYSAQTGYKTITIKGKVSDSDGNNVTVSSTIGGVTKSVTINNAPTAQPGTDNLTLTWDVASDNVPENVYSGIIVSIDDGLGGTASTTLIPIITIDKTAPTVSVPTSGSIGMTSLTGIAAASDPSTPMQYLFNLNDVDQGTWQAGNTYNFTGLTLKTTYTIKYKAVDSVGNVSGYSGTLTVTTLDVPPPPAPTITTMTGALVDIANNGDGRDLRVMFKGAPDESKIQEYRIYVVKTINAIGFNETTAESMSNTQYMKEPVKGKLRLHLTPLPSTIQDSNGTKVQNGTDYTVFVLSYAKPGSTHKLITIGTIKLDANVPFVKFQAPTVSDVANYGDGRDIRVTFKKPISETDIKEYWIFAQNTSDTSTFDEPQATANTHHYVVTLDMAGKMSYSFTLPQSFTDITGGVNTITNGQQYKIYVLAVMNKTGTANMLSFASKPIRLLATVPSVLPVRNFSATKVGSGHAGGNISVTFGEPSSVMNIQEYRIFISAGTGSLDLNTANGINDNTKYIKVDSTDRYAQHTVALIGLNNTYNGTALAAGDYKTYILIVGKTSQYANRLMGPSKIMKLD